MTGVRYLSCVEINIHKETWIHDYKVDCGRMMVGRRYTLLGGRVILVRLPPVQVTTRCATLRNRVTPFHDIKYECEKSQRIAWAEEKDQMSVQLDSDKGVWLLPPFLWKEIPWKRYYIFQHWGKVTIIRLDSLGC